MNKLYSFGYRMLSGIGEKGPESLYRAIRAMQRECGDIPDNHQLVAVLEDIPEYGIKSGQFVYVTDGVTYICDRARSGEDHWLDLDAKEAQRDFYRGMTITIAGRMHAYACYLLGHTGWMGDDFLVWLSEEWRGLFKR